MTEKNSFFISKKILAFLLASWVFTLTACGGSSDATLKEKLLDIETSLETCPNISGTYEFIGTPLTGMPSDWRGMNMELALDLLLWPDRLPKNRDEIKEVEIQQTDKIQAVFKKGIGQQILVVPEGHMDHIGCAKDEIIQVRMRDAYGQTVSGKKIIKNTYSKNPNGSLNIIVEVVGHLRWFLFFYKYEETYGARFAPIKQ